jgi:hypothetical protein
MDEEAGGDPVEVDAVEVGAAVGVGALGSVGGDVEVVGGAAAGQRDVAGLAGEGVAAEDQGNVDGGALALWQVMA